MAIFARARYLKISPTKLERTIKLLRKKSYLDTLALLEHDCTKKSKIIWKLLHSAASNAVNNFGLEKENLYIKDLFCTKGPILKRTHARAKGKATKIEKRFSHLTVELVDKTQN